MNAIKIIAVAIIIAGLLGLAYGNFSYTKDKQEASLGSLQLVVKDKETVVIPIWLSVGAIVVGGALLLFGGRKP